MIKVAFAITTLNEIPFEVYCNHIKCLVKWSRKYQLFLAASYGTTLVSARESCLNIARANKCDYILYVDSDVILPLNTLDCLISNDSDLASGLCMRRGYPYDDVAWIRSNNGLHQPSFDPNAPSVYPVEWVGGGAALFKVSSFDKLKRPYFKHVFKNGRQIYEDVYLCMKMREKGMIITIDSRVQCGHLCRSWAVYPKNAHLFKKFDEDYKNIDVSCNDIPKTIIS